MYNEQKAESCPFHLISVIVPVYKVEKYLDRCVNSIVNQTYSNLEIILVDDGSPDNCPAMCDEWAQKDPRIRVIHNPHKGLGSARNTGIDAARGSLIGFVDSDDYVYPNMYRRLYELMTENDADLSVCEHTRVDEEGQKVPDNSGKMPVGLTTGEEMMKFVVLPVKNYSWHCVLAWNKLYKAEIFRSIRFPKGSFEDSAVIHRIFGAAKRIIISGEELYYYTLRERAKPKFQHTAFHMTIFTIRDRYKYFTEKGMKELADMTLVNAYGLLVNNMREVNYFQFRKDLAPLMRETMKKLILSCRIGFELRAVKLVFVWLRSMFKPFLKEEEIA